MLDEDSPCPDSCSYQRDRDDPPEVWCFKPGGLEFSDECPATTATTTAPTTTTTEPPPDIPEASTEVRVLYEEDGIIVEQEDSYNNLTREAKIVVPAHGNNSAIEVIMQESTMVTADDDFCQLSSVPDNIETGSMEVNADVVANTTANTTISKDVEDVVYGLKLTDGDLSEEEEEQLSPTMKEACGGKPIVKITVQKTDKDNFNTMAAGGIVDVPETTEKRKRIRRQTGCTNVKVKQLFHQ